MHLQKPEIIENQQLRLEINNAKSLAKRVSARELNPFDQACVQFIKKHSEESELDDFRQQLKRICELAGLNYELEKSSWWAKYHQRIKKRD